MMMRKKNRLPETNIPVAPENKWLEDFLRAFGLFSGVNC